VRKFDLLADGDNCLLFVERDTDTLLVGPALLQLVRIHMQECVIGTGRHDGVARKDFFY
jgi:hypothetical protein